MIKHRCTRKNIRGIHRAVIMAAPAMLAVAAIGSSARAALYWDSDGTAAGNTTGGSGLGGTGNWLDTGKWWDGISTDQDWSTGNDAVFAGSSGTVTLGSPTVAGNLTFNTSGYTITGSSLSIAGPITMNVNGAANITTSLGGTGGLTFSGFTQGSFLILNTANTYTGTTTISSAAVGTPGGTLAVNFNDALPTTTNLVMANGANAIEIGPSKSQTIGKISGGGKIILDAGSTFTTGNGTVSTDSTAISSVISGTGTFAKMGAGILELVGNNGPIAGGGSNFQGPVVIHGTGNNEGFLRFTNSSNLGGFQTSAPANTTNILIFDGGGILQPLASQTMNRNITCNSGGGKILTQEPGGNGETVTYTGVISGGGSISQIGSGTLILDGSPTVVGGQDVPSNTVVGYKVESGTLQLGNGGANGLLSAQPFDYTHGYVDIAAGAKFVSNRNNGINIYETITGAGTVDIFNGNSIRGTTFANDNTYTGKTTVHSGHFRVGVNAAQKGSLASSEVEIQSGANFDIQVDKSWTYAGVISGSGGFNKIQPSGGFVVSLTGTSTHTGATTIQAQAGSGLSIGDGGTTGDLPSATIDVGAGAFIQYYRSNDSTYAGVISGAGELIKKGSGRHSLTGANLYTGATTVSEGTLAVNGSLASGSAVAVKTSGTIGGTGTIAGALTIENGGHLAPGNSAGTLNATGGVTQQATAVLDYDLASTTTVGGGVNDLLAVTGNLSIDSANFNLNATDGDVANGTYKLITYSGTLTGNTSGWTIASNNASGSHSYSFSTAVSGEVDLIISAVGPGDKTWTGATDSNWSTSSNWNPSGEPNAVDATSRFLNGATTNSVTVDADKTVGTLVIDSSSAYTISGSNTLHVTVSTGSGAITVGATNAGSHTISAPLSLDSNTVADVASGSSLTASSLTVADGKSLTKNGGGTLAVNRLRNAGTGPGDTNLAGTTLTINQGKVQVISTHTGNAVSQEGGTTAATSVLASDPTIASGATLDLANNDLIIRGGNLTATTALIRAGRAAGSWTGTGITSSRAAAHASSGDNTRALGVILASSTGVPSFSGQTVTGTDVLVKYTYAGDANLDGKCDFNDFTRFLNGFTSPGADTWFSGDFNYSGFTTFDDFNLFLPSFTLSAGVNGGILSPSDRAELAALATLGGQPLALGGGATPAPEPGSLGLLAAAGGWMLGRRRRR